MNRTRAATTIQRSYRRRRNAYVYNADGIVTNTIPKKYAIDIPTPTGMLKTWHALGLSPAKKTSCVE